MLERYGDNVDAAIKKLEELQLNPQSQKDAGIDPVVGHEGQPEMAEHANGGVAGVLLVGMSVPVCRVGCNGGASGEAAVCPVARHRSARAL